MAVTKVINSESKAYKPVLTDMLVLDAVPTVNSLNGITSDAVARAVAGASGEVPQVTENDNGKVLTAIYDEGGAAVEWAEAQGGGSSYTAGDGITISDQDVISATTRLTTTNAKYCYDLESKGTYPAKVRFLGFGLQPGEPTPLRSLTFDSVHTTVDGTQFTIYLVYNLNGVPPTNLRKTGQLIINSGFPSGLAYSVPTILCYPAKPDLYSTITMPASIALPDGQIVEDTYSIPTVAASINQNADQYTQYVVKIQGGGAPADVTTLVSYFENNGATALTVKLPDEVEYLELSAPDQTYNATSTKAQSGVAVAEAISGISVDEVPDVGSSDDGKVLTASYSGGQGSYSWQTAQGGGGGGASYTAGQGIAIDGNNAISVDAGSRDFTFGQYSTLNKASNNYNFYGSLIANPSVICTKDSYIYLANETGNLHLVCDNSTFVPGNYAVCNTNYAFSNWQLTSDVKIALSKTASDWTFTGGTFTLDNGLWYLTIAGTTGSTITPNGETPVNIETFGIKQFDVISNPNQLSLKNPITVDQSYNASSTNAQSGTAVAQALANAGGITWTKISGSSITTTSYTLAANLSHSIPSGKTAVQVTIMLRLSNISGTWSNIPKQLSVKLKLGDDYGSSYYYVGSIMSADAWFSGSQPTLWMVAGTVVVPGDWYTSIDGITLELPCNSTGSLPPTYDKDLFVGIA